MNAKIKKILKTLASVAIAAVLVLIAFRKVDSGEFFSQIKQCKWVWVVFSMLSGAAAFAVRGLRWRDILRPIDPSTKLSPAVNAIYISNLANMVIPYSGEFFRCGVITAHSAKDPETGKPLATYDRVIGTAVLERGWDLLSIFILTALLLAFKWEQFGSFMSEKLFMPFVQGLTPLKGIIAGSAVLLFILFFVLVFRMKDRAPVFGKVYGVIDRIWQGFVSCFRMDRKLLFFVYTMLIWGLYWLQIVLLFHAFSPMEGLGLADALFIMLVGSVASVLPIPGGFGAYHYIVSTAIFAIYGLPQESVGIVFATLAHESQALMMLLAGIIAYAAESLSRRRSNA